jgi:hypothetical protein
MWELAIALQILVFTICKRSIIPVANLKSVHSHSIMCNIFNFRLEYVITINTEVLIWLLIHSVGEQTILTSHKFKYHQRIVASDFNVCLLEGENYLYPLFTSPPAECACSVYILYFFSLFNVKAGGMFAFQTAKEVESISHSLFVSTQHKERSSLNRETRACYCV